MTKYIIKRLLLAVLTVFIICAITFFLMHAIPGGPFNREKALDPATIAALNARYNLDKPLLVQFGIYIKELFKGDFGVSLKNGLLCLRQYRALYWQPCCCLYFV